MPRTLCALNLSYLLPQTPLLLHLRAGNRSRERSHSPHPPSRNPTQLPALPLAHDLAVSSPQTPPPPTVPVPSVFLPSRLGFPFQSQPTVCLPVCLYCPLCLYLPFLLLPPSLSNSHLFLLGLICLSSLSPPPNTEKITNHLQCGLGKDFESNCGALLLSEDKVRLSKVSN